VKLYTVGFYCKQLGNPLATITSGYVYPAGYEEGVGAATILFEKKYPTEQGYYDHKVSLNTIPDAIILRAAEDIKNAQDGLESHRS